MIWKTRITQMTGVKFPLMMGAFAVIGRAEFASAFSNADGLGILTAINYPKIESFQSELENMMKLTDKPFGVNFTLTPPYLLKKQREIYLEESKMIKHYESVLKKWESDIKQKERYINSKKDEIMELENKISKIDQKEILYEIDTQKDHIMTNLEVALNNADIFLKNNFSI